MDWRDIDWTVLDRLRAAFLAGSAGEKDYWLSERDLASYDQTFAQRIGWKWNFVLAELTRRGWRPPSGELLDWGCGTGIAGRVWLDHFGVASVSALRLWDRSPMAVEFAKRRALERFPGITVQTGWETNQTLGTLLLSHVLTELSRAQEEELLQLVHCADTVVWVEPGTYDTSRRLSQIRDRLRSVFTIVAPCPHQLACGMLSPENTQHWCHHFATPPPEAFTDGNWPRFAHLAGIDLRSLPLSFLVLDKRAVPPLPTCAVRLVGRPRVYKGHALLLGCGTTGVCERRLSKRRLPDQFRDVKKRQISPLQLWTCEDNEIASVLDQPPAAPDSESK